MNHLINTAFFTKEHTSTEQFFQLIRVFFEANFQVFQGRHTDWLLLNEPDLAEVTPLSVAMRYRKLHELYEAKQAAAVLPDFKTKGIDFNQLTKEIL